MFCLKQVIVYKSPQVQTWYQNLREYIQTNTTALVFQCFCKISSVFIKSFLRLPTQLNVSWSCCFVLININWHVPFCLRIFWKNTCRLNPSCLELLFQKKFQNYNNEYLRVLYQKASLDEDKVLAKLLLPNWTNLLQQDPWWWTPCSYCWSIFECTFCYHSTPPSWNIYF